MPFLFLELHIEPERFLDYYRGRVEAVHAVAENGVSVQFPAKALQRHVTRDGIHGRFRLEFDSEHKFVRLDALEP